MFESGDIGRISPDEQADALRTVLATFLTSIVRPGEKAPRNAVTAEILDILDEVPEERREGVAQLFAMMTMRLRRTAPARRTIFRLALEGALQARRHAGAPVPDGEAAYLAAGRPGLADIDAACSFLEARQIAEGPADPQGWATAQILAAALVGVSQDRAVGGPDRDGGDLAVAEFLLRAAAQYLAGSRPASEPSRT